MQPDLLCAVLAVLPPGLSSLEIRASRCAGPLLGLIGQRFTQLARLALDGNAARINWAARGVTAVVPVLERLELTFSWPLFEFDSGARAMARTFACHALPDSPMAALRHAARLTSLDLSVVCSLGLVQLLASVPSLRALR